MTGKVIGMVVLAVCVAMIAYASIHLLRNNGKRAFWLSSSVIILIWIAAISLAPEDETVIAWALFLFFPLLVLTGGFAIGCLVAYFRRRTAPEKINDAQH